MLAFSLSALTSSLPILLQLTRPCFAAGDGPISQRLWCDPGLGNPPAGSCADTLTEFDDVIKGRGYDQKQQIEFHDIDTIPQSDQYPHEVLSPNYYTFFSPPYGNSHMCVIEFKLFAIDNTAPASVIATHEDLRAAVEDIIAFCMFAHQVGGANIVASNSNAILIAYLLNGNADDLSLQKARQSTLDYHPKDSTGDEGASGSGSASGGASGSGASGSGGGASGAGNSGNANTGAANTLSPEDKGKGFLSWYCNKLQDPSTCLPGFSCQIAAVANQAVLWGLAMERVRDFVGLCSLTAGAGFEGTSL
ncbi:MAG: hypothetical protein M1812_000874 [Candelaria pacifica]|nr:MAG: hypothetical protein M1812_000874 [Candelaria pacifica]